MSDPDGARETVLIVDDTPANLRLLSQMLSDQGYNVRAVTSGERALASVQAEPPDLVLLDIRMPEMDGYQVCERLKTSTATHDIPVIFISALDATEDKVQAFTTGGVDYITKPFQVEEVLARVRTHLALRRLQAQLQQANRTMARELALAGQVQASFLPETLPAVPGWQLAAALRPAGDASGDFYDVSQLADGRLAILVADVVDKGVAAALYMALSWSLIRTYAPEYPDQPECVLEAANRRILLDTRAEQFVTAFFGVLDPASGTLVYCCAGHCPPVVLRGRAQGDPLHLVRTGVPLGIYADSRWERRTVRLEPGDALVLYTDGITEANDGRDVLFGEDRLLECLASCVDRSAQGLLDAILANVVEFVGDASQSDDIALAIVRRDS
jgi:sigma-B regulation protein RsbU (phosphoserine phosphatase)